MRCDDVPKWIPLRGDDRSPRPSQIERKERPGLLCYQTRSPWSGGAGFGAREVDANPYFGPVDVHEIAFYAVWNTACLSDFEKLRLADRCRLNRNAPIASLSQSELLIESEERGPRRKQI